MWEVCGVFSFIILCVYLPERGIEMHNLLWITCILQGLGSAAAGLAITYALQVSKALQQFVYFASETELTMNAVERVAA